MYSLIYKGHTVLTNNSYDVVKQFERDLVAQYPEALIYIVSN